MGQDSALERKLNIPGLENSPYGGPKAMGQNPNIMRKAWQRWIRVATAIGTVQMIVTLSLIYWILLPLVAIPFRLLADPLALRGAQRARWVLGRPTYSGLEFLKKQF